MEKQNVIQELHRIQDLWNKILPLTEKSVKVAFSKDDAEERRKMETERKYHYNSKIKIANELSTFNATLVESEIAYRHEQDCLKTAKKKLGKARVVLIIATIIGFAIALFPHIRNFAGNNLDKYNFFSGLGSFGELYQGLVFAEVPGQGDTAQTSNLINIILAVFSVGAQLLTIFLAGVASFSIVKAKAGEKVPKIGRSLKGLWIAATIIVGIFGTFTWVTIDPIGAVGLLPVIILTPILKANISKLEDSKHPYPTAEESARLEKAKAEDAQNHRANEVARNDANAKEKKTFEAKQKKYIDECDKEIAGYDREIEQLTDDIAAMMKQAKSEILSDKDNNLDTVNRLLNYLENGRADTLKEALYMVDMDKEREKDRETQKQIAQMKLENDRFMAELDRQEARRYNDQLLSQQRAHNERMQREQDRHNAQVEREQEAHNREMKRELDRLKDKLDS